MELNAIDRRKFGYVLQSVLCKSRTDIDQQTALVSLRLCHVVHVCLYEV